jgi:hypothetical protein
MKNEDLDGIKNIIGSDESPISKNHVIKLPDFDE